MVGNSGSGKSLLGRRIAAIIDAPYVELDAIHHLPGWEAIDPETFLAEVEAATASDAWVVDGNYRPVVLEGPVWQRADTVVWLDLPRRVVMRQVTWRTVRRVAMRRELWNGNRESWRSALAWDPRESIIRWSWTQHPTYRYRYVQAMTAPQHGHLRFVRLRSRDEAEKWLASLVRRRLD